MSDSVTNAQVEDVLSSIRRLVGENKRSAPMTEAETPADRLVLTPQLRVSDHDVLLLNSESAVDPQEAWFEYEEPPFTQDDDAEESMEPASDASAEAPSAEFSHQRPPEAGFTHNTVHDESIEAFFAKAKRPSSAELTERIAALEDAIERASDIYEPEGDEDEELHVEDGIQTTWASEVDLDATGAPVPDASQHEVVVDPLSEDEQVIDEGALRDLVADIVREELEGPLVAQIVREELQGDLGERITRNVRKMVRVEIQRALAARALD